MLPGRRRRIIAAVVALAVLGAGALIAYQTVKRPGDISNPDVEFVDPTPTSEPEPDGRPARFQWPMYGFTKDHRRVYEPRRRLPTRWRPLWKRRASALLEFPPVIKGDLIVQLADDGWLVARSKTTGRRRWRRKLGHLAASTPAVAGNTLYVTILEIARDARVGRIAAVRLRDGRTRWSRRLSARSESSPIVDGGHVYFGAENGTLYALRARTGDVVWRYRARGAIKGSPTLSGGVLYVGDYGGYVQAVRAANGRRIWSEPAARRSLRSGRFYATAAVAFGRVYIGSTDGRQYSLSARSGRVAWAKQTGGFVYSSAAVDDVPGAGPTVFFGSYDGTFYALDARSGDVRWRYDSGGKISGAATIIDDVVYFADLGRSRTYGLRTRGGRVVFRRKQGGYDPVISDGRHLFLTGRFSLTAMVPLSTPTSQIARLRKRELAREARRRHRRLVARRAGIQRLQVRNARKRAARQRRARRRR